MRLIFKALVLATALTTTAMAAEPYPSKTINIVLPLAAGTGMDSLVRVFGDQLQTNLGKPVVVRNETGASFLMAPQSVARSVPDGHTLLATVSPTLVISPNYFKQIPYDPDKDFEPISAYVQSPFILVASPKSGIKTAQDMIRVAREQKGALNYATFGVGTQQSLAFELIKQRYGFDMQEVPYRATQQILADVGSGDVQLAFVETAASQTMIREGKLIPLAVSSKTRLELYPEVPSLEEALGQKDFEIVAWHILLAPAQTPPDVLARLRKETADITASPRFTDLARLLGLIVTKPQAPDEIRKMLAAERERWGLVMEKAGLKHSR